MQDQDQETEAVADEVEVAGESAAPESEKTTASDGGASEEEVETVEEPLTPEMEALKWKEAAIRSAADLDNYRKRMARAGEDLRFARSGLIENPSGFDNFAMGLQMAEQDAESMIYKGMAMVKGQLDDFLDAQGVKEVAAEGVFDPNYHEAVAEEEKEGAEAGEILFVKRKGYVLHDRLLRAAAVVVAKGPADETAEDVEDATEGGNE